MDTEFKNYKLSKEEQSIVETYEGFTMGAVIFADDVTDQETFIECMQKSVEHFKDIANDLETQIDSQIYSLQLKNSKE